MPENLAGTRSTGVHRYDLLVEVGERPLILAPQVRIETTLPIPRNAQLKRFIVRKDCLLNIAIADVARLVFTRKMVVHLRVQNPIREPPLRLIEKTIGRPCSQRGKIAFAFLIEACTRNCDGHSPSGLPKSRWRAFWFRVRRAITSLAICSSEFSATK